MPSFDWFRNPRQSYVKPCTHQTYLSKALFEHATGVATLAAVATSSSTLLNSSLVPNLAALIPLQNKMLPLFTGVFAKSTTLQFCHKIVLADSSSQAKYFYDLEKAINFLQSLVVATRYFCRSLRTLIIGDIPSPEMKSQEFAQFDELLPKLVALESLVVVLKPRLENRKFIENLAFLPKLTQLEVDLRHSGFGFNYFKMLADALEKRTVMSSSSLASSPLEILSLRSPDEVLRNLHDFRENFCGRILANNSRSLTKLNFEFDCESFGIPRSNLGDDDLAALMNANLERLSELSGSFVLNNYSFESTTPSSPSFVNLVVLQLMNLNDASLIRIGNECSKLKSFTISVSDFNQGLSCRCLTWDIDYDKNQHVEITLHKNAFENLEEICFHMCNFRNADHNADDDDDGEEEEEGNSGSPVNNERKPVASPTIFSQFISLKKLSFVYSFERSAPEITLARLPRPELLENFEIFEADEEEGNFKIDSFLQQYFVNNNDDSTKNISSPTPKFPNLKSLRLASLQTLTPKGIQHLQLYSNLETLNLESCPKLTSKSIQETFFSPSTPSSSENTQDKFPYLFSLNCEGGSYFWYDHVDKIVEKMVERIGNAKSSSAAAICFKWNDDAPVERIVVSRNVSYSTRNDRLFEHLQTKYHHFASCLFGSFDSGNDKVAYDRLFASACHGIVGAGEIRQRE